MKNIKETIKSIIREESEYETFFRKALDKAGKGIADMSDDEKKAFFNKIDTAWTGKGEKNEALVGGQKKLDVDGDGEIEASDLAALRAGKKADESINEEKYTVIDPRGNQMGASDKGQAVAIAKKKGGEKAGYFVVSNKNALKARRALEKFKGDFKNPKLKDMMADLFYESVEGINEATLEQGTKLRYEKNSNVVDYVVDKKYTGRDGFPKYILKVVKSNTKNIKVGSTIEYDDARLTGLIRNRVMSFVKNESVNEASKPTIKVVNNDGNNIKNEQGIQIIVVKTTKGEILYGGFVVRGKLQKVIPAGANKTKEDVKKRALQIWDEFGKQLGESESVVKEGKLGDTWKKNNKKGYILKVGNIELKSAGPSNSHDILIDRHPWGSFAIDYEAGGTDWWVKPMRGSDFWVKSIDDIVAKVKTDARFSEGVLEAKSISEAISDKDLPNWLFDDPIDFEDWYEGGMELANNKGKLAPFSSSDEKKLFQLVGMWQDAEGDYQFGRGDLGTGKTTGARSASYSAQDLIKKFLTQKGKVVKNEGNTFGAERSKAIAKGDDSFKVDGEPFKVTGVDAKDKENAKKFSNENTELPKATIPAAVQAKLDMAIEKIKDTKLTYNQKLSLIGKVMDGLGVDKGEFNKMASKLKGTMEGDLTEIIKSYKPGDGEYIARIYSGHLKGDERYSHALTVVDVLHANGLVTKAVAQKMEQELANSLARLRKSKSENVNEGSAFGMAVNAAKKEGLKEFEFNGKMYKVKTGSYEKNEAAKKPVVLSGFTLVPEKKK